MVDFYSHTRACIDKYNIIADKIKNNDEDTTEDEDEFMGNFCLYLSHALIQDVGFGGLAREELGKTAKIINCVV